MTSVVKSTLFEADFAACALSLNEANPSAASRFVDTVEAAIGLMARFPEMGPVWRYGSRKRPTHYYHHRKAGFIRQPLCHSPACRMNPAFQLARLSAFEAVEADGAAQE